MAINRKFTDEECGQMHLKITMKTIFWENIRVSIVFLQSICEVSLHCTYYAGFIEVKLRVAMMELKLHVF